MQVLRRRRPQTAATGRPARRAAILAVGLLASGTSAFAGEEPASETGPAPPAAAAGAVAVPAPSRMKLPVYAEVGLGFGKTLFFGGMRDALRTSYGGAFDPGFGNNLLAGFVVAPKSWYGLGVGARIKGTFGSPVKGDGGDEYIFNDYAVSLQVKFYPFAKPFDEGPYARAVAGFGQLTTKRQSEAANRYRHQYAIGLTAGAALGYTLPVSAVGLSLEATFEYSNRSGTADGLGNTSYESGQLAGNVVVTF